MLPEAASREIYEAWHPSVENNVSTSDTPWAALVLRHLKPGELDDRSVLEIGCGRGELVRRLVGAVRGPRHLVAADFAQSAVQSAPLVAQWLPAGPWRAELAHALSGYLAVRTP